MEIVITLLVAGVLVAVCLVVLARRSRGSGAAGAAGTGPAETDAQARGLSQRGSDRQGMGPS